MTHPQASVDWPGVFLGVIGTGGAVIALIQGDWLWAAIIFLVSIVAESLLVLARRRRGRRPRTS